MRRRYVALAAILVASVVPAGMAMTEELDSTDRVEAPSPVEVVPVTLVTTAQEAQVASLEPAPVPELEPAPAPAVAETEFAEPEVVISEPQPEPPPPPVVEEPAPAPVFAPASLGPRAQVDAVVAGLPAVYRQTASQVNITVGCHPTRCALGVWDFNTSTLWFGPHLFDKGADRVRDVVIHEITHAIDWRVLSDTQRHEVYAAMGNNPTEHFADCAVKVISGGWTHYWSCPGHALAVTKKILGL
jgi:hypothetical protein